MTKTLPEIVEEANRHPSSQGFRDAALACLLVAYSLGGDDLALPDFRVAAQTFATLAVAEAIGTSHGGDNLVQSVRDAGGIQ